MEYQKFVDSYQKYYHIVFSSIFSKLNINRMDAEDITQEIFLLYYTKIKEVKNPRKWLNGTLRNKVSEFLRAKHHKEDEDINLILNDVEFTYMNGFKDIRIMIKSILDNAGVFKEPKDEAIFNLIVVHDVTFVKAAESTGITKSTVRRKYYRMIDKVTEELQKQGIKKLEDIL